MALKIPKMGLPAMLKDGYQHMQGLEESVYRNIQATRDLVAITRTSFGPNGCNKMVINHLEKLFVTSDAATIMRELEVVHPAAKLLVGASQQQDHEMGDGTNLVVCLAGQLLQNAEYLLRMGLHPAEVIQGYTHALHAALEIIETLVIDHPIDCHSHDSLLKVVLPCIAAKQYGYHDLLANLVVKASLEIMPKNPKAFNVDSVRIVKVLGSSIHESSVVKGMVFGREPDSILKSATNAKIAIFNCGIDVALTETKGTVLIENAKDMLSFSKGEEERLEASIKALADAGVNVIVAGSTIGELAMHFLNRYKFLVVKVLSKFDLRRLSRVAGATALTRFGVPTPEEAGYCEIVETIELGSDRCTVFRQTDETTKTATIILRGATQNALDDLERAIDDGVNTVKAIVKDPRLVAGAGALELELSRLLVLRSETTPGLDQYCIEQFGEALQVVPRTLCENAGLDSSHVISHLLALHAKGDTHTGVDIESDKEGVLHSVKAGVIDLVAVKISALTMAARTALTLISVDQIIMSKAAGGPKPKKQEHWDEDD